MQKGTGGLLGGSLEWAGPLPALPSSARVVLVGSQGVL